jgi:hypothetical protein
MSTRYEALFSSDSMSKKRKRFVDGIVTINREKRHVKVEFANAEDTSKALSRFSGVVDEKKMVALLDEEEVQLGSIIVVLGQIITSNTATVEVSLPPTQKRIAVAGINTNTNTRTGIIAPFRPPRQLNVTHSVPAASEPLFFNNYGIVPTASTSSLTSVVTQAFAKPNTTAVKGTGLTQQSSNPGMSMSMNTSMNMNMNMSVNNSHTITLPNMYQENEHFQKVPMTFLTLKAYCNSYEYLMQIEIQKQLSDAMINYEMKARSVLGLLPANVSSTGTNTGISSMVKRVTTTNNTLKNFQNIERHASNLFKVGIPYMSNVTIIVSAPRDEDSGTHGSSSSNKGSKRYPSFTGKKNNDNDDNNDSDSDSEKLKSQQIKKIVYLKFESKCRDSPTGTESYGKDDLWVVWNNSESQSINYSNKRDEKRQQYIEEKSKGYPFPWHGGSIRAPFMLVRSCWYNISAKGMLEVCLPDGSTKIPSALGTLPAGNKRGQLNGTYSAVRLLSCMTDMFAWISYVLEQ